MRDLASRSPAVNASLNVFSASSHTSLQVSQSPTTVELDIPLTPISNMFAKTIIFATLATLALAAPPTPVNELAARQTGGGLADLLGGAGGAGGASGAGGLVSAKIMTLPWQGSQQPVLLGFHRQPNRRVNARVMKLPYIASRVLSAGLNILQTETLQGSREE